MEVIDRLDDDLLSEGGANRVSLGKVEAVAIKRIYQECKVIEILTIGSICKGVIESLLEESTMEGSSNI